MTKIVWTDPAVQDIASIHSYITRDSIVYADALLLEIFHFVEKLEQFPIGKSCPELNDEYQRNNCWKLSGHLRYRTFKGQDSGCFAWCSFIPESQIRCVSIKVTKSRPPACRFFGIGFTAARREAGAGNLSELSLVVTPARERFHPTPLLTRFAKQQGRDSSSTGSYFNSVQYSPEQVRLWADAAKLGTPREGP